MSKELLQQFEDMDKFPIFEFKYLDENGEEDWVVVQLVADVEGIHTFTDITVEWDDTFSLDEHLQEMYELVVDDLLKDGYNLMEI